jgi:hypothetical protein
MEDEEMIQRGEFLNPSFIHTKAEVYKTFSDGMKKNLRMILPSGKSLEWYVGWLAMNTSIADIYIRMNVPIQILQPLAQINARLCYVIAQLPYPEVEEFCKRFQEYVKDENTSRTMGRVGVGLPPSARKLPDEMSDVNETVEFEEVDWDAIFKIEEDSERFKGFEGRLQETSDGSDTSEGSTSPECD